MLDLSCAIDLGLLRRPNGSMAQFRAYDKHLSSKYSASAVSLYTVSLFHGKIYDLLSILFILSHRIQNPNPNLEKQHTTMDPHAYSYPSPFEGYENLEPLSE